MARDGVVKNAQVPGRTAASPARRCWVGRVVMRYVRRFGMSAQVLYGQEKNHFHLIRYPSHPDKSLMVMDENRFHLPCASSCPDRFLQSWLETVFI